MANYLIQPQADHTADPTNLANAVFAFDVADPGTVSGLTNGTAYVAREFVLSPASAAFTPAIPATAPAQMGAPTLVVDSASQITATLAAAPSDGGSAITSYDLRYSNDAEATWTTETGVTSPAAITGLTASTLHSVQTRAVNAVGVGAWSASATATTSAAPAGPIFFEDFSAYDPAEYTQLLASNIDASGGSIGNVGGTGIMHITPSTPPTLSAGHSAKAIIATPGSAGTAFVYLKHDTATATEPHVVASVNSFGRVRLVKRVAGSNTLLAETSPSAYGPIQVGDEFEVILSSDGNSVSVKYRGASVGAAFENADVSDVPANTGISLRLENDWRIDTWEADDV